MTPKEDQQPMTTREELVAEFLFARFNHSDFRWDEILEYEKDGWRTDAKEAIRLASRQEVSVEASAREFQRAMLDNPTDGGFNARATARERIADEYARALLAEYSITKRTTEG